jgi:cell fate regulator YaaT (PSP1 superfamily)
MCCLTYEYETYKELKASLPKLGKKIRTTQGQGKVIRHLLNTSRFVIRLSEGGQEVELSPQDIVKEQKKAHG